MFDLPLFLQFSLYLPVTHVALVWAVTHEDLAILLVDLWVVCLEPGKPKYDVLLPQTGDYTLHVPIIVENCIYDFGDRSSFIQTPIDVEYRYIMVEFPGGEPAPLHILAVHELSSAGPDLTSAVSVVWISALTTRDLLRTWGSSYNIVLWETSLPGSEVDWAEYQVGIMCAFKGLS
jgi:hypothetical protein